MKRKVSLSCTQCGSRNYSFDRSGGSKEERLEIKKFCRHCNAHTIHKETK